MKEDVTTDSRGNCFLSWLLSSEIWSKYSSGQGFTIIGFTHSKKRFHGRFLMFVCSYSRLWDAVDYEVFGSQYCDFDKGTLRGDINISVRPITQAKFGSKVNKFLSFFVVYIFWANQ